MTAALNAVRHSLAHAAQTDQTDLLHSSQMGHGDRPDVPDIASQPGSIPLPGALTLALADYPSLSLPSRPTRKEHCDVE